MERTNLTHQLTQYEIDNNIAKVASITPYTFRQISDAVRERSITTSKRPLEVSKIILSEVKKGSPFKI